MSRTILYSLLIGSTVGIGQHIANRRDEAYKLPNIGCCHKMKGVTMMKKYLKIALFGFLTWLIPFVASFLIFPLRSSYRPLFESIMAVVVTASAVLFAILYFRKLTSGFLREGILTGVIWFIINIVLDLMLFMEGPMKMSFSDYMMDIGLTYLIIPVVTAGFGYLLQRKVV